MSMLILASTPGLFLPISNLALIVSILSKRGIADIYHLTTQIDALIFGDGADVAYSPQFTIEGGNGTCKL